MICLHTLHPFACTMAVVYSQGCTAFTRARSHSHHPKESCVCNSQCPSPHQPGATASSSTNRSDQSGASEAEFGTCSDPAGLPSPSCTPALPCSPGPLSLDPLSFSTTSTALEVTFRSELLHTLLQTKSDPLGRNVELWTWVGTVASCFLW